MTPHNRRRIDIAAARYLDALERADEAVLSALWDQAANDSEMLAAFREIHAGLVEEDEARTATALTASITAAVEKHLPSAEIVKPAIGPVTVADVAQELFRHTPDRLPVSAHVLNERLRSSIQPLPDDLSVPALVAWSEPIFGPMSTEYWEAFRQAAIKVRMRRASDLEFQMAARKTTPKRENE